MKVRCTHSENRFDFILPASELSQSIQDGEEVVPLSRNEAYRSIVENAPDIIVRFDRGGRMLYANPAFERVTGQKAETLIGRNAREIPVFGRSISRLVHQAVLDVVDSGLPKEVEINWGSASDAAQRFHLASLAPEFDRDGRVAGVLLIARDISGLRAYQRQLQQMAFLDPLTRLPNRALFNDRLNRLIADRERSEHAIAGIMLLDLDGFKKVNDGLGHETGDRMLCEVGERIQACLRNNDTVARLGGDEFAVIIPKVRRELDLAIVARKILESIGAPFRISGKELFVGVSIGIACYRADSVEPSELLRFADIAMYHAKEMGRNNYQFYSETMTRDAQERMELEGDLRKALREGELELFYQPKVDTLVGLMVGAEALLRWRHPRRGVLKPDSFIGIAEETGLINAIGGWVLHTACSAVSEYNRDAAYPVRFSVNLSLRQFTNGELVETVRSALSVSGCRPQWLELELTESHLMPQCPGITESLEALDRLGIAIAIDDFGSGYSSLAHLSGLPIRVIKIDRSFIQDITVRKKNLGLVRAIVSIGHELGIELVAVGVETGEQAACLDSLGCHIVQGYYYGQPMPEAEFRVWQSEFFRKRNAAGRKAFEMARTQWRDYLITGHELIDAQHQEIFKRISRLKDACGSGRGQAEVSVLLDFLGEYVLSHFAAEEEMLASLGSPSTKSTRRPTTILWKRLTISVPASGWKV